MQFLFHRIFDTVGIHDAGFDILCDMPVSFTQLAVGDKIEIKYSEDRRTEGFTIAAGKVYLVQSNIARDEFFPYWKVAIIWKFWPVASPNT